MLLLGILSRQMQEVQMTPTEIGGRVIRTLIDLHGGNNWDRLRFSRPLFFVSIKSPHLISPYNLAKSLTYFPIYKGGIRIMYYLRCYIIATVAYWSRVLLDIATCIGSFPELYLGNVGIPEFNNRSPLNVANNLFPVS